MSRPWRSAAEWAAIVLVGLVLTIAMTYPVAFRLDRVGRLNTDDGRWSIWVVAWVANALTTAPATLFDANIFYPQRQTLAYSESNLLAGAMGAPVWLVTRNPYTTYNAVLLAAFVLAFVGMYALARHLVASRGAALVAAILFAFCPYMFARTAHSQLLFIGTLPLALLAFHRFVEAPGMGRAVVLGGSLWAAAMGSGYYGIFAALMLAIGIPWFAVTRGLAARGDYWSGVVLAGGTAVGLTAPVFLPYLGMLREGFERTLTDAARYSATPGAWAASAAWAHRWWLPHLDYNEVLFPGLLTVGLGAAALVRLRGLPTRERDVPLFYAAVGAVAFWVSFGPEAGLYAWLHQTVPAFTFLRAPSRVGLLTTLALCVLSAMAVRALLDQSSRRRLAVCGLVLAATLELARAPLTYFREAPPAAPAYQVLATLPRGAVAEFPYWSQSSELPRHAYYMLNSTLHWQPLVNGYSDHIPRPFRETMRQLGDFPSEDALWILGELKARYVALHLDLYGEGERELVIERLAGFADRLRPLVQDGSVWLFELTTPDTGAESMPEGEAEPVGAPSG